MSGERTVRTTASIELVYKLDPSMDEDVAKALTMTWLERAIRSSEFDLVVDADHERVKLHSSDVFVEAKVVDRREPRRFEVELAVDLRKSMTVEVIAVDRHQAFSKATEMLENGEVDVQEDMTFDWDYSKELDPHIRREIKEDD